MLRIYTLVFIFCLSGSLYSNGSNEQAFGSMANYSVSEAKGTNTVFISQTNRIAVRSPRQSEMMPVSLSILLIAIGFALIFLDDHLKKAKERKK